ncbi:RING finger protein 151 isoform X2 [Nematostella vectensis]|uniref:RING finger protein 151 isoform X2 n=1 Tax=Nematostella vectensis TaxID=45351 RepID=UPI0020770085|nr:RING finger protein 151 isoform X2 [Nematostella vectensis]
MGVDLEYFDDPVPSEFLCSYCRKVYLHPLVTGCGHVLCTKCYNKRSIKHLGCPLCGKSMGEGKTSDLDPMWKRRYERIHVNCTKGCEQLITIRDLEAHLKGSCPLTRTICPNSGCNKKSRRRDLPLHLSKCEYREVECEGCGHKTRLVDLRMHQIVKKCTRRKNLHMIVQNRRAMDAAVREHRIHLQGETFKRELQERDLEKMKMWDTIMRNNPNRPASVTPSTSRSHMSGGDLAVATSPGPHPGHWQPPRSRVSTPGRPHSPLDTAKLCLHCNKLFLEEANHDEACRWHQGPIVDVFGVSQMTLLIFSDKPKITSYFVISNYSQKLTNYYFFSLHNLTLPRHTLTGDVPIMWKAR